ncbi:MAG: EamA family transporter [Lachnospiraceae bacterium]|nr:EamA family transporter [Lachnospiraceae bacterium]
MWLFMAVLSALFAGLTSILAKCGIRKTDSDVATALRTIVVLVFSFVMVLIVGSAGSITDIAPRSLLFLILSGLATGASWLCYYYAIGHGIVSVVVPIDKMSILVSVGFSFVVFKEKLSKRAMLGLMLMLSGTLMMALWA